MCGYRHSLKRGESTCTYFANDKTFKENGDWAIKKKRSTSQMHMKNGATTRRKWQSKLGRRNEKLWERVRVDRFGAKRENGGSVDENRGKIM